MWLLILLGLLARLWQFGRIPLSLYWDEVAIGLDARSLLQTGLDINQHHWLQPLFFSYGDYKAPVYIWFTTLLGKFLSVSELTVRLPSLLAFLGIAWVFYRLLKLISPPQSKIPLYSLTSLFIMPWSIHFSRIGFESHLSLFWLVLSVYLVVLSAKSKKPWLLIISALATSLGIYTYISLRLLAPAFFIFVFILYHHKKLKSALPAFITGLAVIFLSIFILLRSPGYSASQQYRLSNDNLVKSTTYIQTSVQNLQGHEWSLLARFFHHRYLYKAKEYLANYFQYLGPKFLFFSGDPNLRHHSGFGGQLLITQSLLLLIGIASITKLKKPTLLLLLGWLALSPAIAALVNETPHASRAIYLLIPLAWLTGLGWQSLVKSKKLVSFLISLALLLNLSVFLHHYFSHYPNQSSQAWLQPYQQAALYLKQQPPGDNIQDIYVTNQWYQPWLYFSFYANQNIKDLPADCPPDSLCLAPPDWQPETTQIINHIPGTDQLVVKQAL